MDFQGKTDETCSQPTDSGRCLAAFRRFTYDAVRKTCKEFIYGGCGGNSNNFNTLVDCQTRCQGNKFDAGSVSSSADRTNGQVQVRNDICNLPKETGRCRGFFHKFAYNDVTQSCEQFVYGGCGGNANRFNTMMECEAQCFVDTEEDACALPLVTGPCRGAFQKYGYDTVSKTCKEFIYGGCSGNDNRFDSKELCANRCIPMENTGCDTVSCVIPIVVVLALLIVAAIVAIVLIKKRRGGSSKKYAPTAVNEQGDEGEMKKVSPDAEDV